MGKSNRIMATIFGDRVKWLWAWVKERNYIFDSNERRNTWIYIYYQSLLTAYGSREFATYMTHKRNARLSKPIDKKELESKIQKWSSPKSDRKFTNEKIIKMLGITNKEITELKIGHNKKEKEERIIRKIAKRERNSEILLLSGKGWTQKRIAEHLNTSVSTVKRVLRESRKIYKGSDLTINRISKEEDAPTKDFVSSDAEHLYSLYKTEKDSALGNEYELALAELKHPNSNLFIQGSAGTGKSTLIKEYLESLSKSERKKVLLLAPTGKAADIIGGVTMHKAFELPNCVQINDEINTIPKILHNIETVIIDEISMVRCDVFEKVIQILQFAKSNGQHIRLICVGDFGQLHPVVTSADKEMLKMLYPDIKGYYAFNSPLWSAMDFRKIVLNKVMRQNNPELIEHLEGIKYGRLADIQWFMENASPFAPINPVCICTTRKRVDEWNAQTLAEHSQEHEHITFTAEYDGVLTEDLPCPVNLTIGVGVRVMTVVNDKYYKNGNIGTVKSISESESKITVKLDNGKTVTVRPKVFELENGTTYKQFPLVIAYAITVHKAQGSTFDNVIIICDDFFEAGQLYCALSRCKSLENMMFIGRLKESDLKVDIEALKMTVHNN